MNPKREEALYMTAMVALTVAVLVSAGHDWVAGVLLFGIPLAVAYPVGATRLGWTK